LNIDPPQAEIFVDVALLRQFKLYLMIEQSDTTNPHSAFRIPQSAIKIVH
jgi:hypothetical protein